MNTVALLQMKAVPHKQHLVLLWMDPSFDGPKACFLKVGSVWHGRVQPIPEVVRTDLQLYVSFRGPESLGSFWLKQPRGSFPQKNKALDPK